MAGLRSSQITAVPNLITQRHFIESLAAERGLDNVQIVTHYEKTANAWLANLDANRDQLPPILAGVFGDAEALRWLQRWRIFFLACAELFGYAGGEEWGGSHYLFEKRERPARG